MPALLQSVHRQLNGKLEENVKKEWEGILEERGVVPGLNELDRLVAEAKTRRERETGMGKQAEVLGVTVKGVAYVNRLSFVASRCCSYLSCHG